MRIIVFSDSHGNQRNLDYALQAQPNARHVFFLGDCVADIEAIKEFYPERIFHIVKGNCDYSRDEPNLNTATVNGVKIIYTHGHTLAVKSTTEHLLARAHQECATIALYGHTHIANTEYAEGVHLVNPGSVSCARAGRNSYAVIDITDKGIMPIIINI